MARVQAVPGRHGNHDVVGQSTVSEHRKAKCSSPSVTVGLNGGHPLRLGGGKDARTDGDETGHRDC